MSHPSEHPAYTPPYSTSPYRWQYHPSPHPLWWRTIDSMANFVLHWQTRFHGHGDMFASCTLSLSSSSTSTNSNQPPDSTLPTSSTSKSNAIPNTSSGLSSSSSSYFTSAATSSVSSSTDLSQLALPTSSSNTSPSPTDNTQCTLPCILTPAHIREALRRLRFARPTVALRLASRRDLDLPLLPNIPPLLARKVDFQVALVYEVVTSPPDLERWLDETIVCHTDPIDWEDSITASTSDGVPPRDRLKVHYWPFTGRIGVEQSHAISDGLGTLLLFDLLHSSIAGVLSSPSPRSFNWGEEVTRLEPAVWDALAKPPLSPLALKDELKRARQVNAARMHGKSTPPNAIEKMVGRMVAFALARESRVGRVLSSPLIALVRRTVAKGEVFPLGLLPPRSQTSERTHTGFLSTTLSATQTTALLTILKQRGLTLAPFLEAAAHMTTTWVRAHRGLAGNTKWDGPNRLLGSFSNAVSKRDTLLPEHQRYLGLCMSGFPTTVPASSAVWSQTSIASPTGPQDPLPSVSDSDRCTLWALSSDLAYQYKEGRAKESWLQLDEALLWETMKSEYRVMKPESYPSMVWLSSLGKVESFFRASHPITSEHENKASRTEHGDGRWSKVGAALEVDDLRLIGRVAIRQPILHVFTFRGTTTIQFSFADWLYNTSKVSHGSETQRQNILAYWLQVFTTLIDAVLLDATQSPVMQ